MVSGKYIIIANAEFQQNSTGFRGVGIGISGNPVKYGRLLSSATSGNKTIIQYTALVDI